MDTFNKFFLCIPVILIYNLNSNVVIHKLQTISYIYYQGRNSRLSYAKFSVIKSWVAQIVGNIKSESEPSNLKFKF